MMRGRKKRGEKRMKAGKNGGERIELTGVGPGVRMLLKGLAEFLKCVKCGKEYDYIEFDAISLELGMLGLPFPKYADMLVCLECWRALHEKS